MLIAAAFVPSAPALVPELSGPQVPELLPVRTATLQVCADLATRCREWVLVGAGDPARPVAARGTFAGFGVDVQVELVPQAPGQADPEMDLSLLIGGWLRAQVDPEVRLTTELVFGSSGPSACAQQGHELARYLATRSYPVGLLVVADGASTLGPKAPGGFAEGSEAFQSAIDEALGSGDRAALAALDQPECELFGVSGRGPWQVAAAATQGCEVTAELRHAGAPFGVGYSVALWDLTPGDPTW